MTANTSSRNYNILALRGANVTDQEYIETFDLDPALAGTPALNDAMLEKMYKENIDNGVDKDKAKGNMMRASSDVKKNGYLPRMAC